MRWHRTTLSPRFDHELPVEARGSRWSCYPTLTCGDIGRYLLPRRRRQRCQVCPSESVPVRDRPATSWRRIGSAGRRAGTALSQRPPHPTGAPQLSPTTRTGDAIMSHIPGISRPLAGLLIAALAGTVLIGQSTPAAAATLNLTQYVNPFIGTDDSN